MIYLYLDDERTPKTDHDWIVVRSFAEAVAYVTEHGIPEYISFDHDLGTEESGYDFAKWLVEQDLDKRYTFPTDFEFNVHSANPIGAANIVGILDSYLKHRD